MEPLVSVIVPVYNTQKFLDKCLLSIENQSYQNIEIIIVNDGSTDNSLDICLNHQSKDKRIKLISQQNKGLSAARNKGLSISNGNYICFIDSDDYIDTNFISVNINEILKNRVSVSICGFYSVIENTNKINVEYILKKNIKNKLCSNRKILMLLASGRLQSYAWNKIYDKKLFENTLFKEGKCFEDVFIMHELIYKAKNVLILNTPLYYYLQRNNSITHEISQKKVDDFYDSLCERQLFFINQKENILSAYNYHLIKNTLINYKNAYKNIDFTQIENKLKLIKSKITITTNIILIFLKTKLFTKRVILFLKRKIIKTSSY